MSAIRALGSTSSYLMLDNTLALMGIDSSALGEFENGEDDDS